MTIDKQKILEEAQRTVARGEGLLMTVRASDVMGLLAEIDQLRTVLRRVEKCTDGAFLTDGKWQVGANVMDFVRRTLWPRPAPGGAVAKWQVPGAEDNDAAMAKEAGQ